LCRSCRGCFAIIIMLLRVFCEEQYKSEREEGVQIWQDIESERKFV
jgi:hypothetical protein